MSELLSQSQRSLVFREVDSVTSQPVVWKVCGPGTSSVAELINEFEISQSLSVDGVRQVLHRGLYQNREAFAYAFFDGVPLKNYSQRQPLPITETLTIALRLADILGQLHQQGIFHLRLNSNHVLYQPETGVVQLIDFSLASRQPASKALDFQRWGSELAYVAPEQTGRLNQAADSRADLYSFGVILYELLTGQLPFADDDIARIVHYHLVKIPTPPRHLNEHVSPALSAIVDKLLAKKADDRYQTAYGVMQDLRQCLDDLTAGRPDRLDVLGLFDQSDRLRLSTKLYGRSEAVQQLLDSFGRVTASTRQLCIVSGDRGTGKSTLIRHVSQAIQPNNGIVLTATCTLADPPLSYEPFMNGLRELAAAILSRSDSGPDNWQSVLKTAVGHQEAVLTRLLPEFRWILDSESASEPPPVRPEDSAALPLIFQNVLRGLATRQQPIVLVAEDVQWADPVFWASLNAIGSDPAIMGLLLLITYRTPANSPALATHVRELSASVPAVTSIHLTDLDYTAIHAFISDSFRTDRVDELSRLAYAKTHGNPFFLRQYISALCREKALWLEPDRLLWAWDRPKADEVPPTDNVVGYVTGNVANLPPDQTQVLTAAAALGTVFDGSVVARLIDQPQTWVDGRLSELMAENFLSRPATLYRFTHELVRQAVYERMSAAEKSRIHYRIATVLSATGAADDNPADLYELATQFTLGSQQIPAEERFFIVDLNLRAGLVARSASDFTRAYGYFVNGIGLLTETDWENQYETVLHLYNQATEMGMITGVHQEAEQWLRESLRRARGIDDRIKAHEIKLNYLTENHQFAEAIAHLLTVLGEIGHRVRRNPSKALILWELAQVKWQLRTKKVTDIPKMPLMIDERAKAFMKLVANSYSSIFGYAPDIMPILNFREISLTLKHGLSVYAPVAYAAYGTMLVFLGNSRQGYEYGKMALGLTDQLNAEVVRAKVMVIFYGFVSFWHDGLRQSIEPLRQAYHVGRQNGDLLFAAFALSFHSTVRLHVGDSLAELLPAMTEDSRTILEMKQSLVHTISEAQRHLVISLVQESDDPLVLQGEGFDEIMFLKKLDELGDQATKFDLYYYKLLLACLFNQYTKAYEASELASQFEDDTTSRQTIYPSFLLFSTIACIKQASLEQPLRQTRKLRKKITRQLNLMRSFAKEVPQNYEHKSALLQALHHEQKGLQRVAADYYQTAIAQAHTNNFSHEEALAREYFAYFLLNTGQPEYGGWMLQQAFRCYQKWGALAKCRQLAKEYPDVIGNVAAAGREITIDHLQDRYDLTAIIHANQTLSSANTLEGLLRRMIEIVIQNASATNVVILLKGIGQQLIPRAVGTNQAVQFLAGTGADAGSLVPESVVNYVSRTMTAFVSPTMTEEQGFVFDPYIRTTRPLSVCCLPIITQNLLLGVLYLENNLAESAFDANRVAFFTTISSQLAISLDNVFLYQDMEQKVQQRTTDLEQSLTHLRATQAQLIQVEKMASLGELTAGIAHEIQNPLNFVNNFAEVSIELADELEQSLQANDAVSVATLSADLRQNMHHINQNGRRAAAIVHSMLEHSRASTGIKQPTDLNQLAGEYLKLAYHGLVVKDKSFKAALVTDFDPALSTVELVQQDIGRVLLNLYSNAFYAVRQKQQQLNGSGAGETNGVISPATTAYQPQVSVRTVGHGGVIEIRVKDNGSGISDELRQKVFQPFFTTKPTGQGTGLGLSLSYDIITKGNGGTLTVESVLNEGAEFIITLPVA